MQREDWHVLKATKPGVNLPALIKEFDIQELRTHLNKQREQADRMRGFRFKRIGPPSKGNGGQNR